MMKKNILAILTLTLVLSVMGLSGCKSDSEPKPADNNGYDTGDAELDEALAKVKDYDPTKFVELGTYKGVEVDTSVTQDDIDEAIMNIISQNTTVEQIKKGKVKNGDTVNIDFAGKIDGEEFEGGSATDFSLEIGSHSFIDGFEEGLIGLSVGESTSLDLVFPDPYNNTDYSGKPVVFDVTINYINGKTIVPEYNDKFVENISNGEYKSADKYTEEVIKAGLLKNKKDSMSETAYQTVLSTSKVTEAPDYLVTLMKMTLDASYKALAEEKEYSDFAQFLKDYFQMSEEQYNEQLNTTASSYVEQKLIAEAIAAKENIKVSEDEYNKYYEDYKNNIQQNNKEIKSDEDIKNYVVKTYRSRIEDLINEAIITQKVMDFVNDNAVELNGTSDGED